MKLWRIAVLFIGLGLFGGRGQAAQCTASPVDAAKARTAMEAAQHVRWPLPVLRGTQIDSLNGFRGALLLADASVFQIEKVTWQINSSGALEIVEFEGYTADGIRSSFTKTRTTGKQIKALSELGGFKLGNPHGGGKTQSVDSLHFATDREGFLSISQLSGVDDETGEPIDVTPGQTPVACGLRVQMTCSVSTCMEGACGAAPGCPCSGTSGGCSSYTESVCFGSCPFGFVCNGSVNNCSCIQQPPPPKTPPETLPPSPGR